MEENNDKPFFLYFSLPDIHVPRAPNQRFIGKTSMGPRGDAIVQMDWMTGEISKKLKELGIADNTLIIFSSDNGPVLDDGYADNAVTNLGSHKPAGIYKGGKYSAYEGGTRVPTIAYWPGKIKPGKSDAMISQVDFFATIAKLVDQKITDNKTAPDSFELLDLLLGNSNKGREEMIEEAFTLSIRSGNWKYIAPQTKPTPGWLANKDVATGLQFTAQLYNLKDDPKEENNLAMKFPEKVKELALKLEQVMKEPINRSGS